ncbi:MAG: glycosyltransferase [Wujia sp.]
MSKRAILIANSASMIDHFNRDNILILQEMGYEITIAANFREGNSSTSQKIADFSKELQERSIDMIDLPIPRNVFQLNKTFASIRTLKRYFKEHPCQIIHTQTPLGGVVGRLAAKKERKKGISKVIYFVHGFHFFKGSGLKSYVLYYNIEKFLARYTDCLITLNHEDYEAATTRFHLENVEYVPGIGIRTDAIHSMCIDRDAVRRKHNVPTDKAMILTVAELIPRKNISASLQAFAKANRKDAFFAICGKGELLKQLQKECETLGINDHVYFLGYCTDILDIYHASDLFLFTSFQEGLPVGVLQAMAAGLPIIASDIRGNRDLLAPTADCASANYLHKTDDIDAFAADLCSLLDDAQQAKKLGEVNYQNCKTYFDLEIVHKKMKNIYKKFDK